MKSYNWLKDIYSKSNMISDILHNGFKAGMLIKGVDGILEILGGFLLIWFNPFRLNKMVTFLTQHELSEDPNDVIANFLIKTSHEFSVSSQYFGVFYLMAHGIVKLFIITMLWQRKIWAYPVSIIFLSTFVIYQLYRYSHSHSTWLVILSFFDIIMILLTMIEYKKAK